MALIPNKQFNEPTGSNSVGVNLALNGNLFVCTSQPRIRLYNQNTLENSRVSQSITSGSQSITLINAASAIVHHSSAVVTFVELSSLHTTTITSGVVSAPTSGLGQLAAGNPTLGTALLARSTSGGVLKVLSNATCSSLTPAALSGSTVTSVITKDNKWLLGTSAGRIMEIDDSGTVTTNIAVPTTPAVSATVQQVIGLVYYNNKVLALTDLGFLHLYDWSLPALLDTKFVGSSTTSTFSTLCDLGSGSAAYIPSRAGQSAILEVYFEKQKIVLEDSFIPPVSPTFASYDPVTRFLGVASNSSGFTSYITFKVTNTNKIPVTTRLQDPAGLDVAGRVIRVRKAGIGRSIVESDTNVGTGEQSIDSTEGRSYFEIAVRQSPEKFDIREFPA